MVRTLSTLLLCLFPWISGAQVFDWTDQPFLSSSDYAVPATCGTITFNPSTLNPWAWYKADSFTNTGNGLQVGGAGTNWIDSSGNGRNAVEVSLAGDPIYTTNVFNSGGPGLLFGPVGTRNSRLSIPIGFQIAQSNSFTVVAFARHPTGVSLYPTLGITNFNLNNDFVGVGTDYPRTRTSTSNDLLGDEDSQPGNTYTQNKMRVWRRNGGVVDWWFDLFSYNQSVASGAGSAISLGWINAIATVGSSVTYGNMYLGELMLFTNYVSNSDLTNLYTRYFVPKYCAPPDGMQGTNSLWFKADSLTNITDNTAIPYYADQSPSLNNLRQTTNAYQPTYRTSIYNGLPTARFSGLTGSTNFLVTDVPIASGSGGGWTVMMVGVPKGENAVWIGHTNSAAPITTRTRQFMPPPIGGTTYRINTFLGGNASSDTLSTATNSIICLTATRTSFFENAAVYRNIGPGGVLDWQVNCLGLSVVAAERFNGDICEVLVWKCTLSTGQVRYIYNYYLKPKWGLP